MEVVSVNISEEKGTPKHAVDAIDIESAGVAGDAHAGHWHRQVSLLSEELITRFADEAGRAIGPGEFAENITTRGLALADVRLLDRIRAGNAELEVTQIGKECHGNGCAIFRDIGRCVMPHAGIFTRVVSPGSVTKGDPITHTARPLRVLVVTVSDRASSGAYEDLSGPRICERIEEHLGAGCWRTMVSRELIPDDADRIRGVLSVARDDSVDVVLTTGGTGVGPRDVTPDVVHELADKTLPGIMDAIRLKYGAEKPAALLSRSVAAVARRTLIYALPGSRKAVDEYLDELLKTLDHLLFTLNGIDRHN